MKILPLLLLFCLSLNAQSHKDSPLPKVDWDSKKVLKDITGWSYSKDGQWIDNDHVIAKRGISTDNYFYYRKENRYGYDNIERLILAPVYYGTDTLTVLVKLYEDGYYQRPAIGKSWKTTSKAYYYVFSSNELFSIDSLPKETTEITLPLKACGYLGEATYGSVLSVLEEKLLIKPSIDRELVFTLRASEDQTIQFQFASMHSVFVNVEGVLHDFTLKGKTLYGTPLLLDYIHYELTAAEFSEFFSPKFDF